MLYAFLMDVNFFRVFFFNILIIIPTLIVIHRVITILCIIGTSTPPPPTVTTVSSKNGNSDAVTAATTTSSSSSSIETNMLELLVDPLLRIITSYLPSEDLMQLALTSKRFHQIIPHATTYDSRAPGTIIPVLCLRSLLSSSSLLGTTTAAVPTPTGRFVEAWGLFCDCADLVLLQCMSSVIASVAARLNNNEYGILGRFQQLVQQLRRHYRGRGRLSQLVHQLQQLRGVRGRNVLSQYQHVSMVDYHEFQFRRCVRSAYDEYMELMEQIKNGLQIEGITSLDFCFSTTTTTPTQTTPSHNNEEMLVFKILSHLFPSLREVDLTHTLANRDVVYWFFTNCLRLEKMTFHNKVKNGVLWNIPANGVDMRTAHSLKELHMDDSVFYVRKREIAAMSDLDNTNTYAGVGSNVFLFHKCSSTVLERVSLRNSGLIISGKKTIIAIPQTALMKFIRNAPTTLRWFRSNLTTANIEIVQHERPEIEFLS